MSKSRILRFAPKQDFSPAMDKRTKRNFISLLVDGAFFSIGSAFLEANTFFPAFVSLLTNNPVVIGLVSSLRNAGYLLPQLLVAGYAERLPLKKPFLLAVGLINRLSILVMAAAAFFWGSSAPAVALIVFFVGLITFALTDGINGVPWTDMVAKTIPSTRRGRLFGTMQLIGGSGAFVAGFVIRQIIASDRLTFPNNYALLMVIGFVFLCVSYFGTMAVREAPGVAREGTSIGQYFKRLPEAWRKNSAFQQMMFVRMFYSALYLSLPFYVIYAKDALGSPESMIGVFISAQMAGSILGGMLWGHIGDHYGNRLVIRLTGVAAVATPCLALLASLLHRMGLDAMAVTCFLFLFATIGATMSGLWMGFTNFLLDVVSDLDRPTYIGMMNTLVAPFTFLPLLGGVLAQLVSHEVLFAVTAAGILLGNLRAISLPEPRHHADYQERMATEAD